MPKELPSVEALKLLVAAINALQTPNLNKTEIVRLRTMVITVETYKELLADYIKLPPNRRQTHPNGKRIQPTRPIRQINMEQISKSKETN